MEIEKRYLEVMQRIEKEYIDFLGVNFSDTENGELSFKIYQSGKISRNAKHPLIEFIQKRGMLRHFADVIDDSHGEQIRLDISLYQRNDSNIKEVFDYLLQKAEYLEPHLQEVENVSKMKITDVMDYNYSSLYHVGVIEETGRTKLVKFHFFTRWCEDPNHHTKDGYRDKEYLEYLEKVGVKEYEKLVPKAWHILERCGGHLWMAGLDVSQKKKKYKIYLKDVVNIYEYLGEVLEFYSEMHLKKISEWNEKHKECRVAGVAIALDSENKTSVNFYYHVD